jgi:preprotein translocase subunit SecE
MSAGTQRGSGILDNIKWLAVIALVLGGIYGYYYAAIEIDGLLRLGLLLAVLASAFGLAITTQRGHEYFSLVREARTEFRKVVWPTISETNYTTVVVLVMTVLIAFILWLLDMLLGWAVSSVIG